MKIKRLLLSILCIVKNTSSFSLSRTNFIRNTASMVSVGSILNPKNDEAIYMLALIKIDQSDYNGAENLINTLRKAGFSDVKLREFDQELDHKDRDYESIYALARK